MLCSLLLILYISINGLSAETQFNCTFPPYPKNGYYIGIPTEDGSNIWITVSEKVKSYKLQMRCNDEYSGVGTDTAICNEDGSMIYADFECLPNCKESSTSNLLSCGTDTRCVLNPRLEKVLTYTAISGHRFTDNFEGCGTLGTRFYGIIHRRRRGLPPGAYASGGYSAFLDELPWHAGVYSKKTSPYMQICGGTLITTKVVISAAHCFWKEDVKQLPASNYAVAVGKIYRPWNEPRDRNAQKSDVAEIRIPPHFQGHTTNLQDDIALLIVESPFTFGEGVRPACLDFDVELDQMQLKPKVTVGKVGGWGLTSENGPASPVLKIVNLPVVDLQECFQNSNPAFRAHITSDKFCAGWTNGTAVCKGDSGGGFFIPDLSDSRVRFFLRGVVSGAPQSNTLCNVHTWASFTHVIKHERFIKDTLEEISASA